MTTMDWELFPHAFSYLAHDAEDNSVDEADGCHPHQTQQEQISVTVKLEIRGFGMEDGAHQLAFLCAEACGSTRALPLRRELIKFRRLLRFSPAHLS